MALPEQWLLIGLLVVAVLLLVSSRVRPDLVAFLVLALLPLTGAVSFPEALSGFSRSVVITIIGLFILSQALEDTGVVQWIADHLRAIGGGSEARLVLLFMAVAAAGAGARENLVDLTEVLIPPRSSAVGKTLTELDFRRRHDLTAVALWRRGTSYGTDVGRLHLEVGDALLMVGAPERIRELERETDFLVLQSSHAARPSLPHKASLALGITAAVLAASIFQLLPPAAAMMLGVVALAFTGCIHLDAAYRSVDWRVVFLVAGMLPLSLAMTNSGLAERIGNALVSFVALLLGLKLFWGL